MRLIGFVRLLRPWQWYKNLLVFVPILFSGNLFNISSLVLTVYGFVSLCLVSGFNYVVNDIVDFRRDRYNPEKRGRPVASGLVGRGEALLFGFVVLLLGLWIASGLGNYFLSAVLSLLVLSQLYNFWLKNEVFADVILLGVNFVIRAASGAFIIGVFISTWLILCTFFLSLVLSVGKRFAEASFLKGAVLHRKVLSGYTKETSYLLLIIASTALLMSYSLYCLLDRVRLVFTLPFALYCVFRYLSLLQDDPRIARHPELVVFDARIIAGIFLWVLVSIVVLYLGAV